MNRTRQNSDPTAFTSKIHVFCRPGWTKGGLHDDEFWHFQIQKWISLTVWAQKVVKNEVICLVVFFPSWSLNCQKSCIFFCKFRLNSAWNVNLLKQFIYIYLKELIMLFQKIAYFIGFWATAHEILRNKISEKYWLSRNLRKFINF